MILFALLYLNHAFFLQMRGTGRPALRLAGRLHALGDAPAGGVPRPGPRGPGRVGRLPPDAGVRRPGLQPAGQGHHHDRPRRAGRAGISAVVRVGDVHLKDTSRGRGGDDGAFIRQTDWCRRFSAKMIGVFRPFRVPNVMQSHPSPASLPLLLCTIAVEHAGLRSAPPSMF